MPRFGVKVHKATQANGRMHMLPLHCGCSNKKLNQSDVSTTNESGDLMVADKCYQKQTIKLKPTLSR